MKHLVSGLLLAKRDFLSWFYRFEEVAVLCYHSISNEPVPTAITAGAFAEQLTYLQRCGYIFVSLDAVVAWTQGKAVLPRKAIALTFDDGYADFETAALPVLERCNAPAALFVMGEGALSQAALKNNVPLLTPEALERVGNHPLVTLGYHSMTHANLAQLSGEALRAEMAPVDLVGGKPQYFAYPGGKYSPDAIAEASALGYRAAFSIKRHLVERDGDRYLVPRSVITRDMSLRTVRFHATRALEWYRALGNLFHI